MSACCCSLACSGSTNEPMGKVTGSVNYKGKPVPQGTAVMFLMSSKGFGALGEVDENGQYVLKAAGRDMVPAGKYAISIRPPTGPEMTPEEVMEALKKKKPAGDPFRTVPQKYRTPETSGLTFEVKTGDNQFDIDMQDGP